MRGRCWDGMRSIDTHPRQVRTYDVPPQDAEYWHFDMRACWKDWGVVMRAGAERAEDISKAVGLKQELKGLDIPEREQFGVRGNHGKQMSAAGSSVKRFGTVKPFGVAKPSASLKPSASETAMGRASAL